MSQRILVVDDDKQIVRLVKAYLEQAGFQVFAAYDGSTALHTIRRERPDLVVLDLMLPDQDGWDLTRLIRADPTLTDTPIIMLTARIEDADKIVGLELGADDYITKPFNPRELVARVKAVLRRREWDQSTGRAEPTAVTIDDVTLDPASRDVTVAGERVRLRQREFDLLEAFMRHPNVALDRERLLAMVWGEDFYGDSRTIDVHVAWLRDKLKDGKPSIETVWGVGYKFVPAAEAS